MNNTIIIDINYNIISFLSSKERHNYTNLSKYSYLCIQNYRKNLINKKKFIKFLYIIKYYIKKNKPISENIITSSPKYLLSNNNILNENSNIDQVRYIVSDNDNDNEFYTKWYKKAYIDTLICVQLKYNPYIHVSEFCNKILNKNKSSNDLITKVNKYISLNRPFREILNLFNINDLIYFGI